MEQMEGMERERIASYWRAGERGHVHCELCPRNCTIKEGEFGYCGIRVNKAGRLIAAAYARPATVSVDPIEKKPLYHFHPGTRTLSVGTVGCNMRCLHCQNCDLSYSKFDSDIGTKTSFMSVAELTGLLKSTGSQGITFTYNEPTIWIEYILEAFAEAKKLGFYTVLVTNGYINALPLADLLTVTDSFRVDLKFLDEKVSYALARVENPQVILDRILEARGSGVHLEVVTNIIPGHNDSTGELTRMAGWIAANCGYETPWHVTRSFPQEHWHVPPTPLDKLREAIHIGHNAGLCHVYPGNVAGLDADTRCPHCGEIAISRSGYKTTVFGRLPVCRGCGKKLNIVA